MFANCLFKAVYEEILEDDSIDPTCDKYYVRINSFSYNCESEEEYSFDVVIEEYLDKSYELKKLTFESVRDIRNIATLDNSTWKTLLKLFVEEDVECYTAEVGCVLYLAFKVEDDDVKIEY
ncbi:MAG: hypothetical protein IJ809_00060 [Clostridia bacterium]|nr:hypothetical protein [Clostridia bacterium]